MSVCVRAHAGRDAAARELIHYLSALPLRVEGSQPRLHLCKKEKEKRVEEKVKEIGFSEENNKILI